VRLIPIFEMAQMAVNNEHAREEKNIPFACRSSAINGHNEV